MKTAKDGEYPYHHQLKNLVDEKTKQIFEKELLNEEERKTAADLFIEYNKYITDVNKFLMTEYAELQNKVTRCMRNRCYDDIFKDRQSIRICVVECPLVLKKHKNFQMTNFRISKMNSKDAWKKRILVNG